MSRRIATIGVATLILAASAVATPAVAAPAFAITVTPDEARPGETFDVTGDAVDPVCAEDGVAVTLYFTRPNGTSGTTTVNTTTDAAGHFTAQLTVPENAVAGDDAFVRALIADCNPPSGPSEGTRASEQVDVDVLPYSGSFTISRQSGRPGDTVAFAGTNCYGGEVVVFFGDQELEGVPEADRTFAGELVLPDLPEGIYEFGAQCPGTDYQVFSFRLINPQAPPPGPPAGPPAAPPAAPPARPVVGTPNFTG
ncbi:MAG TPA: hypothetical protein VNA20_06255 [Frankiaceae bacterium]|nr:hypothetical protein [Frankiaceae bacterium]